MSAEASNYILAVEDAAKRATTLVERLATGDVPAGAIEMPQRELRASECAGLVFTSVTKAGAVLSVDVGSGFVLAKVKGPDGAAAWSAPLFFSLLGGGIGMTLGVSNIDSVTVLGSPEALAGFAKDQFELGSDMTAAGPLGKVGSYMSTSDLELGPDAFTYAIASGAIVSYSANGMRYALDAKKNLATYGPDATPQAILEGKVEAPRPMAQLTDALTKFMTEGRV